MNSKQKGSRGERELASKLKEYGFDCRRGQHGRFRKQVNTFKANGNIIECYSENGELLFFTDLELLEKLKEYSYGKWANGYACVMVGKSQIPLHRFLVNAPNGKVVDHINRNKIDNRICNLRICGKSLNAMNCKIKSNNTSGYRGVWLRKDTNKWVAEIKVNYKKISLGCYESKADAIRARRNAENEYKLKAERQGW